MLTSAILVCIPFISFAFSLSHISSKDSVLAYDYLINEVFAWKNGKQKEKLEQDDNESESEIKSFLDYYNAGVDSYLSNDWESCIENIERSIELYKDYYEALTYCQIECEFKRRVHKPLFKQDFEQRQFFEEFLFKTSCIEKCRRHQLSYIPKWFVFGLEFKDKFIKREHYNYLNICYYKRNNYTMAASAAYTALIGDVTNSLARQNLEYYMQNGKLTIDDLIDMEAKEFSKFYIEGLSAYKNADYKATIEKLENSLTTFIREVDQCRSFCDDGQQLILELPDFYMTIANSYMYNLRCKLNCTMTTQVVQGLYYTDILPSIYEYLQHSYYQLGDTINAVKASLSFLLFKPDEDYMLDNVDKYLRLPEIEGKYLKARSEAEEFYLRNLYELKLLNKMDQEFKDL